MGAGDKNPALKPMQHNHLPITEVGMIQLPEDKHKRLDRADDCDGEEEEDDVFVSFSPDLLHLLANRV